MADSDATFTAMQQELESMVECPIHYGILVQPKSLPCGHVMCLDCVRRWVEAKMGILVCPECNSEQILPSKGVDGLPNSYKLSQLCEYLGNVNVTNNNEFSNAPTPPALTCRDHPDMNLDRICRDCKQPVCQKCAGSEHAGHMCLDAGTFMQHMDRPLKKLQNQARERNHDAGRCLAEITKMKEQLRGNRDSSLATLDQFIEKLFESARAAGSDLRGQVESMYSAKEAIFESQEHAIRGMIKDIKGIERLVSEDASVSLNEVSSLPPLLDDASRRLKEAQNTIIQSAPKTSSDIWAEMDRSILEKLQSRGSKGIGRICTSEVPYPNESILKVISETPTLLSKEVEVELTLNDGHGNQVKAPDPHVISAEVINPNGNRVKQVFESHSGGKFVTKFMPQCIGKYRLIAKLYNIHVRNSPMNIIVHPRGVATLELRGHTPFRSPHDIRKVGENFVVLDDEKIQVVDKEGRMVNKFVINDNVFHPYAIAYNDQAYYVTALKGKKVVKFSRTGLTILEIGMGIVQAPTGIAIAKTGDIYVADYEKDCIYVFSPNGTLQYQIASPGNGSNQLSHPWFIKFNRRGQLLVADSGNQRIQIFDTQTCKGVKSIYVELQGHPLACRGLDVDANDNIYVTCRSTGRATPRGFIFECVMVYGPDGEFLGSFADSPARRGLHYVRGIHVVDGSNKTTAIVVDGGNNIVRFYVI